VKYVGETTLDGRANDKYEWMGERDTKPTYYFFLDGSNQDDIILMGKYKDGLLAKVSYAMFVNAPLYGTYSWNKDEWRRPNPEGEQALLRVAPIDAGLADVYLNDDLVVQSDELVAGSPVERPVSLLDCREPECNVLRVALTSEEPGSGVTVEVGGRGRYLRPLLR